MSHHPPAFQASGITRRTHARTDEGLRPALTCPPLLASSFSAPLLCSVALHILEMGLSACDWNDALVDGTEIQGAYEK